MSIFRKFLTYMKPVEDEEDEDYLGDTDYSDFPKYGKKKTVMERFLEYMKEIEADESSDNPSEQSFSSQYEIDFNSFRELPECTLRTLIYKVISADGHETGTSVIVIPKKEQITVYGNDFGRLTDDARKYLKQQMKDFCNKTHNEY